MFNSSFITKHKLITPFSDGVPVFLCEFNLHHYHDYFFTLLDIDLPGRLSGAVVKRKAEFLAGRYCASMAISGLGVERKGISIGENRSPIWPNGLIGSISHCNGLAVSSVDYSTKHLSVGVDVENTVSKELIDSIKPMILLDSEESIMINQSNCFDQKFTSVFSAKESFFKAAYPLVGKYFDFHTVKLVGLSDSRLTFLINRELNASFLRKGDMFTASYLIDSKNRVLTQVVL